MERGVEEDPYPFSYGNLDFLSFLMRDLETPTPFWVRVWAGGGQTDKFIQLYF